jgi:cysteine-rich repeat protein
LFGCNETCGDGKRLYEECDDGNLSPGDGCSPSCTVEPNFLCTGGTETTPDTCVYQKQKTLITVTPVEKTLIELAQTAGTAVKYGVGATTAAAFVNPGKAVQPL